MTYNSKIFAIMGYVLIDNEWCKKESTKAKADLPKVSKNISNPVLFVMKEIEEIKKRLKTIEKGL